jgi:hypothetical protein
VDHPYKTLPAHCFWKRSVVDIPADDVDPVVSAKFRIGLSDHVATAGSCFAQHISRHLAGSGFNYLVTESAHPLVAPWASKYQYGVFTARYGNIYTSRQLHQLIERAYGLFSPGEDAWPIGNGRYVDPFRPQIQPGGFSSLEELHADRKQHLAAVRRAIKHLDVLVFTLGLTEGWICRADGAALPLCPGVAGGSFDEKRYTFVNLSVTNVVEELVAAIQLLRANNPSARVILTVSPVPLIATMEDRSVLVSTTYSKSVLRVAAEEVAARYDFVAYFPSYEIVTGGFAKGRYFADDLRSVTEAGVAHVMRLFMHHYTQGTPRARPGPSPGEVERQAAEAHTRSMEEIAAVICDEEALATSS